MRGRGPLPALRIGVQPYGVLPVCASGSVASSDISFAANLERFLDRIRAIWHSAAERAPRLGCTDDPARDLTEVLGQASGMQALAGRSVLGRQYLENLWRHPFGGAAPIPQWAFEIQRLIGELLLAAIGAGGSDARILQTANMHVDFPLLLPLVQAAECSEEAPLEDDYVQTMVKALHESDVVRRLQDTPDTGPLLYLLLRHAALLAMGGAAVQLHLSADGRLVGLPSAELERLLTKTLDVLSYRFDAWQIVIVYLPLCSSRPIV